MTSTSENNTTEPSLESAQERVLRVASLMFAQRGLHVVSVRDIAAECKVSVSTVLYHGGGTKQQLARRVLRSAFLSQDPLLQAVNGLDPDALKSRDEFFEFWDLFAAVIVENSAATALVRQLWLRLALDDPSLFRELDAEFASPLAASAVGFLQKLRDRDIISGNDDRLRHFVASIDWIQHGYFLGGVAEPDGCRSDPVNPNKIAKFLAFLKDYGRSFFAE